MTNELKHKTVGTELTQSEWEAIGTHVFNNQATGDILYASSGVQLSKLAIGSTNNILTIASGIPAWTATPTLTSITINREITSALSTGAYAASYNTLTCTAAQTGNVSQFASWNELYFTGTTAIGTGNAGAVWGHIEISGAFTGPASTSTYLGSVIGTLMSDATTVTNTGIMGAFIADSLLTSGFTNDGKIAAFVAHVNASHPTRANWPLAIYVDGADSVFGFGSGTAYEDGVKITSTVFGNTDHDLNADAILRCYIGSTAYYIPMVAAGKVTNE